MTPEQAMKSLADEINERIRLNLERRRDLRKKYEQVAGQPYTRHWWKTYQRLSEMVARTSQVKQ